MKKMILGLVATFMMTVGLVGFSTVAAQACDYRTCLTTRTTATVTPHEKRHVATIHVRVRAEGSGAVPTGSVTVRVRLQGQSTVLFRDTKKLVDGKAAVTTTRLRSGTYVYRVNYVEKPRVSFKSSSRRGAFTLG